MNTMTEPDWDAYPDFFRYEFECKCGCGRADMDPVFMAMLQEMRTRLGFGVGINSGFRCPEYNAKVSPKTGRTGPHTTGKAADPNVNRDRAYALLKVAFALGFDRIGMNQKGRTRFVHLDTLQSGHTVWSY